MKKFKLLSIVALLFALVGGALYAPMSRHIVVFDGKTHIVEKDKLGWDNTHIDLDKEPLKWRIVLFESKSLRTYFMAHYKDVVLAKLKKQPKNLWGRFKSGAIDAYKKGKKWLKEKGPQHLKTLKKGAKDGLTVAKEKGKKLLQKHAQ